MCRINAKILPDTAGKNYSRTYNAHTKLKSWHKLRNATVEPDENTMGKFWKESYDAP